MTCTSCSSAIEHAISQLPGVSQMSVALLSNKAEVRTRHRWGKEVASIITHTPMTDDSVNKAVLAPYKRPL